MKKVLMLALSSIPGGKRGESFFLVLAREGKKGAPTCAGVASAQGRGKGKKIEALLKLDDLRAEREKGRRCPTGRFPVRKKKAGLATVIKGGRQLAKNRKSNVNFAARVEARKGKMALIFTEQRRKGKPGNHGGWGLSACGFDLITIIILWP